jgi:uncharacterized protein YdhG (YjbR/CyaY superfamily)
MQPSKNQINTIDDYIKSFPDAVRPLLEKVRQTIRQAAPGAKEAISYQIPTFKFNGNLVHFAAYKNHIGFYPAPSGITAFRNDLAPYLGGKGSVRFPLDMPIPYELIKKIVVFRVKENSKKSQLKNNQKNKK